MNYLYPQPQPQMVRPAYPNTAPYNNRIRPVSSLEEVRASAIDFDGSVFYFPDAANKTIYTKQINLDGTALVNMYVMQEIPVTPRPEQLAAAQAQCCCETNRNIDAVRYENARNTGDVIHNTQLNTRDILESQNAGFQRILDFLTNDKIESLRNELQSAQLQLGNMSQTTTLINTLRPFPAPAYITNSPYTAIYPPVTTTAG